MPPRLVPMTLGSAPTISVQRPVMLIGRHPECDVRIDLSKISRRHCCIALAYDRVVVRDLGSRNGVRVNGLIVEEANLNPGDELAIGPLLFRVENPDIPNSTLKPPLPALAPPPNEAPPQSLPFLTTSPNHFDDDLIPIDL